MESKLKEIEVYLSKLKMETNKVPNFDELKKHYHALCKLHPDCAGEGSTEAFQEITEASRIVFLFIVENPELQTMIATEECENIIKCFEKSNDVNYNNGNLVFHYDDDQYEFWMKSLEKWLGKPSKIAGGGKNSFMFQTDNLEISKMRNFGSVTASIYLKPTTNGRSKIMLQGSAFMAFLTFAIPEILKGMKTEEHLRAPLHSREMIKLLQKTIRQLTKKQLMV